MRKLLLLLTLLASPAFAQGVPNTAFVVTTCGSPPSTYQVGQNRPQTMNTQGLNCDAIQQTALAQSTLPTLSAGSQSLYENLNGSLFVQPSFAGTLVDGSHGLPVNVIAGSGGTSSNFAAAFPAAGTAIGVKNGANMVNLTADNSNNLNVTVATALPAGTAIVGKFGIDQTTPGTTNAVQVTAGAAIIGKVGIDQTTPGTTNGVQVNAALPAGTNLMGKVGIDQTTPGTTNGVQVNAALPAGTNIIGKAGIDQTTDITTNGVEIAPTAGSAAGITPNQIAAAGSSLVLKNSAGNLYTATISVGATALYLMIFNNTSAPGDGAVTPAYCFGPLPINAPYALSWAPGPPAVFSTGITLVSSTTGCFTKTASNSVFLAGQAK
jgi:hypothetical protein